MKFVYFLWISGQTANFALQNIKRLVFIAELESVYCAVRTESDTFRLRSLIDSKIFVWIPYSPFVLHKESKVMDNI